LFFFVIIEKKNKEPKDEAEEGGLDDNNEVEPNERGPQQEIPDKKEKSGLF